MFPYALPEPGQLVEVRRRRYIVNEVRASTLSAPASGDSVLSATNLVSLASVEDDGLGEELQVLWELEAGARVFEKENLPEVREFDDPARLDAFLDAVRWGAVSSADVKALQSPFRSGIEIEDYQLDPVVRALQMPRVNLLIADDVGLGKTIEAGLVLQELILRHRVRTALVLCPASLQVQWQEQMRDKFGLEFRIIDSAALKDLRRRRGLQVNPWTHFPRLITSMDYLKRDRPLRLMQEVLPARGESTYPRRFDLMIVDEAHNVAPSGIGRYAIDSQRTMAVRMLAPHFEHKIFLSATPHNGYKESFSALLELLDNQRFARDVTPNREQLAAVMVRRLKSELPPRWDGTPRFPAREIVPLEVPYTDAERRIHRALQQYAKFRQQGATGTEQYAVEFVLKLLKKRLFSSPAAFAGTLGKHLESLRATAHGKRTMATRPTVGILRQRIEASLEDAADDEVFEEATAEALAEATTLLRELTAAEKAVVDELKGYAETGPARPDAKAATLVAWLNATVRPGGRWNDERVLIFTEYRTTQKWLYELLAADGFARDGRLLLLYGGMPTEDRERIKAAFQADPVSSPVRILLATDAASEGIDLQNHCYRLVHYEIPWNPNRLEQRNGRLDRHGQRAAQVLVHHFVGKGFDAKAIDQKIPPGQLEGDLEFLMRTAIKTERIREDLGKVGPVIAAQVEEAMLGRRRALDTTHAEQEAQAPRRLLRIERNLREQISRLHDQLQESRRELHVDPANVRAVISVALELAGQPPLEPVALRGVASRADEKVFRMPALTGSWARCTEGLAHPHTQEIRSITFDHAVAQGRDVLVLVHLNHRLAQMAMRLLRAEVWASGGLKRLHRVTARLVPDSALDSPAVIVYGRLLVLGGDNHRLHEEIITAGGLIREGRFSRFNVGEVKAALAAAQVGVEGAHGLKSSIGGVNASLPDQVPAQVRERLVSLWPTISSPLFRSLEARMKDRTENLGKFIQETSDKEAADIASVLGELAKSIRTELADEVPSPQLTLWKDEERDQLERNRTSLLARLERIPDEITRASAAIRARYADPTPRLFPVAVMFLVPAKLVHVPPPPRGEGRVGVSI